MPFTRNAGHVEPFEHYNEARKTDIGATVRADTNEHTGSIYASGYAITLIIGKNEISEFLTQLAAVATIASQPIDSIAIASLAHEPTKES